MSKRPMTSTSVLDGALVASPNLAIEDSTIEDGMMEDALVVDGKRRLLLASFRRLADGDLGALDEVYDLCVDDLYGLALWRCGSACEAADSVQDVFVKLATRGSALGRVRDPRAYLLTMARRAACDQVRRRRDHDDVAELVVEAELPDPVMRVDAGVASRALARLPAAQREAVFLRHLLGMTFKEVGRIAGVPTFTAASRCRLGLRRLRQLLVDRRNSGDQT